MSGSESGSEKSKSVGKQPAQSTAMSSVAMMVGAPTSSHAPPRVEFLPPSSTDQGHSRASDAGSVKGDSASEAGSTASMDTSMSAGTLASGASTAFFSQQAHVFSLDDFSGHEIQTILEDGEQQEEVSSRCS